MTKTLLPEALMFTFLLALILFAAALGLLAAELFVPSHGILAACCIVVACIGVGVAWQGAPALGVLSALIVLIGSPFAFYWAVRLYPQTPMGRRILLGKPKVPSDKGFESETNRAADLLGQRGRAVTPLRPTGACEFQGRRIDCVSESTVIDPGEAVEVVQVIGLKVIVKKAPAVADAVGSSQHTAVAAGAGESQSVPRWFYQQDGQSKGPVSQIVLRELLQRGEVPATTLIWAEHLKEWQPAQAVTEFQSDIS